jgi:hypothetical protein
MFLDSWGATPEEVAGPVAGDALLPDARLVATRSIDLERPPIEVLPWLEQIGYGRAGWYSYDWIDNLGRRSADRIHPEWQGIEAGDPIPAGPIQFTAAIVERPSSATDGAAFVMQLPRRRIAKHTIDFVLAFDLRTSGHGSRLVTRVRSTIDGRRGSLIERCLLGPGDGIMVRRQLINLQRRTRHQSQSSSARND